MSFAYFVKSFSSVPTRSKVVSIAVFSNSTNSINNVLPDKSIISSTLLPIKNEAGIKKGTYVIYNQHHDNNITIPRKFLNHFL